MASLTEREAATVELLGALMEQLPEGQVVRKVGFTGCSMRPMLRQGIDAVDLTRPTGTLRKYDLPMYKGPSGKYVMHRIVEVHDDHCICRGDNTYGPERVTQAEMVAVVCAFYRGEKRIPVDNMAYQLYARAWVALFPVRKWAVGARGRIARALPKGVKQWLRRWRR